MINILIKRSIVRYYFLSKRYSSTNSNDVFQVQERGFFHDNLAEIE